MPDRVSWLAIRPGWRVLAADGTEIGQVDEVTGDEKRDIFDGLSVAVTALGQPRYVDSDHVDVIEEGVVHLSLDHESAAGLEQYLEPPTSLQVEPDDHRGFGEAFMSEVHQVEGELIEPPRHERRLTLIARLAHWVSRRRG